MKRNKLPITIIALFTFCLTLLTPMNPAAAFSVTDVLPQAVKSDSSSSSGGNTLLNILIGLLMGTFLDKITNVQSKLPAEINQVLGMATSPKDSAAASAKGEQIIATAKTLTGVPYVFGGNDIASGLDCSSFTQYVMKQNGISLPRTAAEQFATGKPVDKANLRVGDLVFFTTYKAGASHVGIYMGNGEFIHESSALGQVGVSSLNEKYYAERYLGARRYF
ncbi:MAG: C40 family peptidase [Negativicutes bacterium]|nr:C40 family peptidase [Negativicutes bacterium]